ncbi:MAG TPA: DUF58 domain-containing protein [Clostridia bacterium]|nr:DUF58 domain-containing protein [Clostridia bacterium]
MTEKFHGATGMRLGELRFRRYHRAERLTRSGFLFFLAIVGIGAVAINSGNNLLYLVFSALLSALIFSGFLSVANLRHVDVALEAADDVIMNRPARLVVRVHNAGSFPLFFATVRVRNVGSDLTLAVPFVPGRSTRELPALVTMRRRGRVSGLWAELSSTFPFGIVQMRLEVRVGGEVVVYPEVRPVTLQQQGERGEHRLEKARAGGDGDFFSLRRYHEGDDARRIDWKVFARRGEPYVTEREARYQQETLFFLDTARAAWTGADTFEVAISKLASALTLVLETGGAFALALPGVFVDGRERTAWQRAMEALACAEFSEDHTRPAPAHSVTHDLITFVGGAV